jgi:hypothetical protein
MNDKTLIFEVTLTVEDEICTEFESYMITTHIPDVVATGCFTKAWFGCQGNEYRASYSTTRGDFERYLRDHAPGLRKDFSQHFPTGVQLRRQNWDLLRTFQP